MQGIKHHLHGYKLHPKTTFSAKTPVIQRGYGKIGGDFSRNFGLESAGTGPIRVLTPGVILFCG